MNWCVSSTICRNRAAVTTGVFAVVGFWLMRQQVSQSVTRGIRRFCFCSVRLLRSLVAEPGRARYRAVGNIFATHLQLPTIVPLGIGGRGILFGAWIGAPRLLQATSREYAKLGARRSIAALVPGFIIAQTAISLGIPISSNNIVTSAVIGGRLTAGSAGVSRRKIAVTVSSGS